MHNREDSDSLQLETQGTETDSHEIESDGSVPEQGEVKEDIALSSDADDSLSLKTKDSIEDLRNSVPRSPHSPTKAKSTSPGKARSEVPPSPTGPLGGAFLNPLGSPTKLRKKQKLKEKAIANSEGAESDPEKNRRPWSPFTSSNALKKIINRSSSPSRELRQRLRRRDALSPAPTTSDRLEASIWEEAEELERAQKEWAASKHKSRRR